MTRIIPAARLSPATLYSTYQAPPVHITTPAPNPANPSEKYPARTHARSAAELLPTKCGLVYLEGQVSATFEDSDMSPKFRQRRYFLYLSGVTDIPDCKVVYCLETDRLTLFIPPLDPSSVLWSGLPLGLKECRER